MKKINIISFVLFICFCGCNTIPKEFDLVNGSFDESIEEDCNKLFQEVQKKWAIYAGNSDYADGYFYNKKLVERIVNNENCFIGLDTSHVISLFGNPNLKEKDVMKYNMAAKKDGEVYDFYGGYYLFFKIDYNASNTISTVKLGKVSVVN